jgi:hypothetical protein
MSEYIDRWMNPYTNMYVFGLQWGWRKSMFLKRNVNLLDCGNGNKLLYKHQTTGIFVPLHALYNFLDYTRILYSVFYSNPLLSKSKWVTENNELRQYMTWINVLPPNASCCHIDSPRY